MFVFVTAYIGFDTRFISSHSDIFDHVRVQIIEPFLSVQMLFHSQILPYIVSIHLHDNP